MFKIYCDMDGVLADFDKKRVEVFGLPRPDDEVMWKTIKEKYPTWFRDLDKMPDADELWRFLSSSGVPVRILSAVKSSNDHITDKKMWLYHHFNRVETRNHDIFCLRSEKKDFAGYGNILIDDKPKNVGEWIKDGGIGILHKSAWHTIEILKEII